MAAGIWGMTHRTGELSLPLPASQINTIRNVSPVAEKTNDKGILPSFAEKPMLMSQKKVEWLPSRILDNLADGEDK